MFNIFVTIAFITNFGGFCITMTKVIHTKKYAYLKGPIFAVIGILNGFSMFYSLILGYLKQKVNDLEIGSCHYGILLMGAWYLIGACFYSLRIPEKYCHKKFDVWCNSHSIFHIFVFLGALTGLWVNVHLSELRAGV